MRKTFIIAEAGVNHNGSVQRAIEMVEVASNSGADAIKFQTFVSDEMATNYSYKAEYQDKNTRSNLTHLKMLKKYELSFDDFIKVKQACVQKNIEFMSTPFDLYSLKFLQSIKMKTYKIPSGEITNLPLLEGVGRLNKKTILSTGMSSIDEIDQAIKVLISKGTLKKNIFLLHCNSEYPTPMENINLNSIVFLRDKFDLLTGLSDHTLGIEVPIAAVALGAKIIEKHFTLSKKLSGPDHLSSLSPKELNQMIVGIRNIEKALGEENKKPTLGEIKNIYVARKSIVASTKIKKGETFSSKNLTTKRPGDGISPMEWHSLIGKKSKYDFKKDEQIRK